MHSFCSGGASKRERVGDCKKVRWEEGCPKKNIEIVVDFDEWKFEALNCQFQCQGVM